MIIRPDFRRSMTRNGRRGVPRVPRKQGHARFATQVGAAAVLAFFTVFYSDQLVPAAQGVASLSSNVSDSARSLRYYARCDDARAAGVAPINVGEPGYREQLDADGDGIACEPYRGY
jgi:hypothetical protein